MKFACTLDIKSLYRYQPFGNEDHIKWLKQILCEHKIHLSNPAEFNDPWDCRVWYNDENLDNPELLEKHIQYSDRNARKDGLQTTEEVHQQRLEYIRENPEFYKENILNEISRGMQIEIDKQSRVYCLSSKPDHILMWSHYADGHQGVCLEFDCNNEVFSGAFKIIYEEKYPFFDATDDNWDHILLPMLIKSSAWAYEDEYRLIALEKNEIKKEYKAGTKDLFTENNFLEIPENSLKSIIVGCKMEDKFQREIENIVEQYGGGHVAIKKACHVPNRYELRIESLPDARLHGHDGESKIKLFVAS